MPQFKKYKLSELCTDVSYGYTESAKQEKIGPKFLRITDIQNDHIDWGTVPYCPISESDYKKYKLSIGDIVIARTGNSTGATATIKDDIKAVFASYLIRFRLDKKIANPFYVDFVLRSSDWKHFVEAIKGGSAQPGANAKQLSEFEFDLPDLPTQTRIASILSSLDDKIELNRRTNHTLEQIAQTLFKKYFVDDIDPENLPEGWRWGKIGELCDYNQKTLSKNDKLEWINYVEISEVNKGYINNIARYKRGTEPSRARRILKHGDTVLSTVRPDRGSYFLAINPDRELLVSTGFAIFTATQAPYSFIFLFLTLDESINYYGFMAHGAAYPAINPEIILRMEIAIPPKNIFDEFHSKVESLLLKFHSNTLESKYLSQLRDSLLLKLVSGEVEVNAAEKELVN